MLSLLSLSLKLIMNPVLAVLNNIMNHTEHGTPAPAPANAPFKLEPAPGPVSSLVPPPSTTPLWGQILEETETVPPDVKTSLRRSDHQTDEDYSDVATVQDPQMIGLVEAPLKLEELVLLVKIKNKLARPTLDTTDHKTVTDEHGNILHCGIKVDNIPVYSECLAGQNLCQVYIGGDCEPSDEV